MDSVLIQGNVFKEGDVVLIQVNNHEDEEEEEFTQGRIAIYGNTIYHTGDAEIQCIKVFICQNEHDGEVCDERIRYGYKCSWSISVSKEGELLTTDTHSVKPFYPKELPVVVKEVAAKSSYDFLDEEDIMPEDWVMTEVIPSDL